MIKKAVFENDLILGMRRELQSYDKKIAMDNLDKAGGYLQAALEIFEEAGLTTQADQILFILQKIAGNDEQDVKGKSHKPKSPSKTHDPHTQGLTPERMVENLKHHGIVFNMADDGKADDMLDADINDAELEVEEPHLSERDFEEES